MPRPTMSDLIARLRVLAGDPAGAAAVWTDDELQGFLDAWREEARYLELAPAVTIAAGGAALYLDYRSPLCDWEADATLYDAGFLELTPAASDLHAGRWTLSQSTPPPVHLVGTSYDLYAAAADALEAWAAKAKLEFDFTAGDEKLSRSQQAAALLSLAARCRQRQRPAFGLLVRTDAAG